MIFRRKAETTKSPIAKAVRRARVTLTGKGLGTPRVTETEGESRTLALKLKKGP